MKSVVYKRPELLQVSKEERAHLFGAAPFALGVVEELVLANLSDVEIAGFRVAEHQTADAGMGLHGTVLCQSDADGRKVDELVEIEVEALVGQAGVTHSRTDALEAFGVEVGDGKLLIGCIAPVEFADGFVRPFNSGFREAVGEGLAQQMLVGISLGRAFCIQLLDALVGAGCKHSDLVSETLSVDGADEVSETEERGLLLAKEG